jgi:cellulase/cellobiase CelA1
VVDTPRNGSGRPPDADAVEPAHAGLALAPATTAGDPAVDAHWWIKRAGTSDGTGRAAAGTWSRQAALDLALLG